MCEPRQRCPVDKSSSESATRWFTLRFTFASDRSRVVHVKTAWNSDRNQRSFFSQRVNRKKKRLPRYFLGSTLVRTRREDTHRARGPTRHLGVWRCLRWDARWVPGEKAQRAFSSPCLDRSHRTRRATYKLYGERTESKRSLLHLGEGRRRLCWVWWSSRGARALSKFSTLSVNRRLECVHEIGVKHEYFAADQVGQDRLNAN